MKADNSNAICRHARDCILHVALNVLSAHKEAVHTKRREDAMRAFWITAACAVGAYGVVPAASAQSVVECRSVNYQYNECYASSLYRPQLIHQISSSSCILNRSWGFNPRTRYIWVGEGCAGTFADATGYHHGRSDTYDDGARHYDSRGQDAGLLVGGAVLGVILGAALSDGSESHHQSKSRPSSSYNGCHGIGCMVDNPDDDGPPEPSFGQPEFN